MQSSDFRKPCFAYKFSISVIDRLVVVKYLVVCIEDIPIFFKIRIANKII